MLHKTVEKNRSRKNIDEGMKDFFEPINSFNILSNKEISNDVAIQCNANNIKTNSEI